MHCWNWSATPNVRSNVELERNDKPVQQVAMLNKVNMHQGRKSFLFQVHSLFTQFAAAACIVIGEVSKMTTGSLCKYQCPTQ